MATSADEHRQESQLPSLKTKQDKDMKRPTRSGTFIEIQWFVRYLLSPEILEMVLLDRLSVQTVHRHPDIGFLVECEPRSTTNWHR